ncbi:MAG: alkaline phosphatase family protein [Bacteroidetes bacterium]|nr:MAG: alkaline phosphatase family protein [Bacteroidota bacterium]
MIDQKYRPGPAWTVLLKRLGIMLLGLQICRLLFWYFNRHSFQNLSWQDFFVSAWLDIVSIALLAFPFIVLSILPFSFVMKRGYQIFLRIIFHLINAVFIALNLVDLEYFHFTQKRSTTDLFTILSAGEDFSQQIGSFFRDFWLVLVFFIVLMSLSMWLERRIRMATKTRAFWSETLYFFLGTAVFVVLARGGFSLRPLSPMDAARYTEVENAALVLNTPFTMVKSMSYDGLEELHYFSEEEAEKLFNPIRESKPLNKLPKGTNVVVIVLESFGSEWVGASGAEESFTPFLDSLAGHSLLFENGIANGKKSIEAVPSIICSVPSLMDNPYISSAYGNNQTESLASILKKWGYESGFFHGATNGSMRFDGFAAQLGFDHYFGRKEYGNDEHFDKTWGILDEYFNPWTARQLSDFKKPFFGFLFTLSSHHPYFIPEHMRGKLKTGKEPICQSINYGDYSLRKFFEQAQKESWYENTLFVICADHTCSTNDPLYNQRTEMYRIPIMFFDPKGRVQALREKRIFQQLDIMPTLLDLLNIDTKLYAYGNSYFQQEEGEAITYIEGAYNYFRGSHMLTFSNDQPRNYYYIGRRIENNPDSLALYKQEARERSKRLKALIQRYHHDLIHNQMSAP